MTMPSGPYAMPTMGNGHMQCMVIGKDTFKLPDWKDNWSTFHYAIANLCRKHGVDPYASVTTPDNAAFSARLADELRRVLPEAIMSRFLAVESSYFDNRGLEMVVALWDKFEPSNESNVFDLFKILGSATLLTSDDPHTYQYRFAKLSQRFRRCHVDLPPSLLTMAAVRGLARSKYGVVCQDYVRGNRPSSLIELTARMTQIDENSALFPDATSTFQFSSTSDTNVDGATLWGNLLGGSTGSTGTTGTAKKKPPTSDTTTSNGSFPWYGKSELSSQEVLDLKSMFKCPLCKSNGHTMNVCPNRGKWQYIRPDRRDFDRNKDDSRPDDRRNDRDNTRRTDTRRDTNNRRNDNSNQQQANRTGRNSPANQELATGSRVDFAAKDTIIPPSEADATSLNDEEPPSTQGKFIDTTPSLQTTKSSVLTSSAVSHPLTVPSLSSLQDKESATGVVCEETGLRHETMTVSVPQSVDEGVAINNLFKPSVETKQTLQASLHCLGSTCTIHVPSSKDESASTNMIIDSGATAHMDPHRRAFQSYKSLDPGYYVKLANEIKLPVAGIGRTAISMGGKYVVLSEVLHVPDLRSPLFSVSSHRRRQGCSFIADNSGISLTFPSFVLNIDDSTECMLPYRQHGQSVSARNFDYVESPAPQFESLAIYEVAASHGSRQTREAAVRRVETRNARQRREQREFAEKLLVFTDPTSFAEAFEKEAVQRDINQLLEYQSTLVDSHAPQDAQSNTIILDKIRMQLADPSEERRQELGMPLLPQLEVINFEETIPILFPSIAANDTTVPTVAPTPANDDSIVHLSGGESGKYVVETVDDESDDDNDDDASVPGLAAVYDSDSESDSDDESESNTPVTNNIVPPVSSRNQQTSQTESDRPNLMPCDIPSHSEQSTRRLTHHQLHRYFGFRQLRNWSIFNEVGNGNVQVVNSGKPPLELGDVANLKRSRRLKQPVPRPRKFLTAVHLDIGYGDCVSIGGFRYTLMLVDRATRERYLYGLRTLDHESIIKALEEFRAEAGGLATVFYTDFDPKLLAGKVQSWLHSQKSRIMAAPPEHQDENGLVERNWYTIVDMARAFITDKQMPRSFWFHALRYATQLSNIFPVRVNGINTTSHELAYGVKPDYRILFQLFSTGYFKVERDGNRRRHGIAEAQSRQGIAIGRSRKANALEFYCPTSKTIHTSADFTLDEGCNTPRAFNLKYEGGIFFGLYDHSPAARGVEPFPNGTRIMVGQQSGVVMSTPKSAATLQIPDAAAQLWYTIRMDDGNIERVNATDMPKYVPPDSSGDDPVVLPAWIENDHPVTFLHLGEYHKGYLSQSEDNAWRFVRKRRNGMVQWGVDLPDLCHHYQRFVDTGTLFPGWRKTRSLARALHVSATGLSQKPPGSLHKAFVKPHPDRDIWLESYREEYDGLLAHDTMDVISGDEYRAIAAETGTRAIPSMGILSVKTDGAGNPERAKARIVALGNREDVQWSKSDCYAPVVPQPIVRLLTALAVRHRRVLKQGDCKNAFCHPDLPKGELVFVKPPTNCPISRSDTYWRLKKTLYGLRRSPRHWYDTLVKHLKDLGMKPTAHEPCLFVGYPIPGKPPMYLALYVDDFIYFSPDPDVELAFEEALATRVKVDFMGDVDYFLGTQFTWTRHDDGHVSVHLSQEGYVNQVVEAMGLQDSNVSPTMTPYRSGLPIDALPPVEMDEVKRDRLRRVYRSYNGMINWLSISTRPDVTTALSLLAQSTMMPTPSHVEAARYVGRYLKATSDLGIEFSSRKSKSLTAFLHFPLNNNEPVGLADAGWGPQDASIPTTRATKRQVPIKETRSICGHIIFMCGGPVLWKSHKERRNSRSSAESEVKTTDECTKSVQWLRNVLDDLNLLPSGPTTIYNDNMAAVQWSNSTSTKGMRHVNIRENAVREAIQEFNEVEVLHIDGKVNISDILTKEHKSADTYLSIRDSFMSRRLHGG